MTARRGSPVRGSGRRLVLAAVLVALLSLAALSGGSVRGLLPPAPLDEREEASLRSEIGRIAEDFAGAERLLTEGNAALPEACHRLLGAVTRAEGVLACYGHDRVLRHAPDVYGRVVGWEARLREAWGRRRALESP